MIFLPRVGKEGREGVGAGDRTEIDSVFCVFSETYITLEENTRRDKT